MSYINKFFCLQEEFLFITASYLTGGLPIARDQCTHVVSPTSKCAHKAYYLSNVFV